MKKIVKVWNKPECENSALPITKAELISLGIPASAIDNGEFRGDLKTFGPWQIPLSYTALAMSRKYTDEDKKIYSAESDNAISYGIRTMGNTHQSGYQLEGRVSINGKKYRAFTSSQLFEIENGKLVDVAIVHVCIN